MEWYADESGLNAVELNASFYRFPFPSQVKHWGEVGKGLAWVIKVNRLITHVHYLNDSAYDTYEKFLRLFRPMDRIVSYYLLQMPPNFSVRMKDRVEDFSDSFNGRKMAFEFRHRSWYNFDFSKLRTEGIMVTPDSPDIHGHVFCKNGTVYIRFHGRRSWYSYNYKAGELRQIGKEIKETKAKRMFAFFNNDHDMLGNAREFQRIMLLAES